VVLFAKSNDKGNLMGNIKTLDLASWVDSQQSKGVYYFIRDEALKATQVSEEAFKKAAGRLAAKKRIARIRGGFFVIIPLEYSFTGIIPADWFIDDLMKYVKQRYYVGLLSAAALHGAAHQQPQQFQIVTNRSLREIKLKNMSIRFFYKKNADATVIKKIRVQTGYVSVSTPEATALDLVRYAKSIGGLDRVLTVLKELGESMSPLELVEAARKDEDFAVAQRVGWLLERAGFNNVVNDLANWISGSNIFLVKLDPSLPVRGAKRDNRWRLLINTELEADF
jgi:predicted transcriptional regulator of viral defense system